MKYFLSFVLLAAFLSPLAAHADMIPETEHGLKNCISISNAKNYSAYQFSLVQAYIDVEIGSEPACLQGHVFSGPVLSVNKQQVADITSAAQADCGECGNQWWLLPANKGIFTQSGFTLDLKDSASAENRTVRRDYLLYIDSVSSVSLAVHLISTTSTDSAGRTVNDIDLPKTPFRGVVGEDTFHASGHLTDVAITLSNLAEYPDYTFYLFGHSLSGFPDAVATEYFSTKDKSWLNPGMVDGTFFAVKTADVSKLNRKDKSWPGFSENTPYLIWSAFPVTFPSMLPDDTTTQTIKDVYHIEGITADRLEISPVSRTFTTYPGVELLRETALTDAPAPVEVTSEVIPETPTTVGTVDMTTPPVNKTFAAPYVVVIGLLLLCTLVLFTGVRIAWKK
jgi:hypothetical protein